MIPPSFTKFLPSSGSNYAQFEDPEMERLYDAILKSGEVAEQKKLMRQYEARVLDEQASQFITMWWYKINPYRSFVKGWKIAPSHYLNVAYDNIWLDHAERKKQLGDGG